MRYLLLLLAIPMYAQFGAAKQVVNGTGAPVSAKCASANNVGLVYARKDGAAAYSTFYVCSNSAASTYTWELMGAGGGGGSGTVTSVDATGGVQTASGAAITATGTVRGAHIGKADTATTYTFLTGDRGKVVTLCNAAGVAVTLPNAGAGFEDGWFVVAKNICAGDAVITPTTATISGAATATISNGEFLLISSNGTNYEGDGNRAVAATGIGLTKARTGVTIAVDTAVILSRATDQAGTDKYCRSTSGNDTWACTLTPTLTAYATGGCVVLNPDTANTGAATLNVDALGAKAVVTQAGAALTTGDVVANLPKTVCYDGTSMVIQGDGGSAGTGGGVISYSATGLTLTAATRYAPPGGGGTPSTTEADAATKAPSSATVTNFQVNVSAAPGAGNSYAFTWRKAGADQSLTCTIADTAVSCTDTTNSFTVAQGDAIAVKIVSAGTIVTTPTVSWLAQFGTTGSNGTVNTGTAGNLSKYSSTGTAVSEQATAAGILTLITTPSSANLAAALTDKTGSGLAVFATSPTLVTPALGTPASGVATNLTGTAAGMTAGLATALVTRTFRVSILNGQNLPDTTGNVFMQPYPVVATNDFWKYSVWMFNDTSTDLVLYGVSEVPANFVSGAKACVVWTSTATTGNVEWGFPYRGISGDDAESLDQATAVTTPTPVVDAAPTATDRRLRSCITLTDADLAAGDTLQYKFSRNGTSGSDTMAAAASVHAMEFEYQGN